MTVFPAENPAFHFHRAGMAHTDCWCLTCERGAARMAYDKGEIDWVQFVTSAFMHLCPDCGNKRCPRATHHVNDCTDSNAAGQPGSVYE